MSHALVVRDLHVSHGGVQVLRGIDLDVAPGEICALMGASGAGKSTVLRSIVALQQFEKGRIALGDVELVPGPVPSESRLTMLRRKVGMVFQAHALFEHLTAQENISLAPVNALGWTRERADAVALRLMTELGVAHRANALPRQLSGGEAQRIAIARALAGDPAMLLMDEPTSALDPARRGALGETLRQLTGNGRSLLIATHDVEFARTYAHRVFTLVDGRIAD